MNILLWDFFIMYIFNILFYRIDGFSFEWVEMFLNIFHKCSILIRIEKEFNSRNVVKGCFIDCCGFSFDFHSDSMDTDKEKAMGR